MHREGVCFAGYGETPRIRPKGKDRSLIAYQSEAIALALENAGLKKSDVNGLAVNSHTDSNDAASIAEWLGFELDWLIRLDCGGAASVVAARRAADAIQLGQADVVVAFGASSRSTTGGPGGGEYLSYQQENFALPYGFGGPNSLFALILKRYMTDHGLTPEQIGKIAVAQRKNAESNENALFRTPMTIADYMSSRVICDPLRLYDIVPPCNGANAIVMTSERKAKELTEHPIYLVSDCEKIAYQAHVNSIERKWNPYAAFRDKLFAEVKLEDIDVVQMYDAYTIVVILQLEGLGFFEPGKAGEFLDRHDFTFSGDFPLNTGGGMLSGGQAGSAASFLPTVEAIRQLKGEAGIRQVKGARTALVSVPGIPSVDVPLDYSAAMILQRR